MHNHEAYLGKLLQSRGNLEPLSQENIRFYRSLYSYQNSFYQKFCTLPIPADFIDGSELPLIRFNNISLPENMRSLLIEGIHELITLVGEFNQGMNFKKLSDHLSDGIALKEEIQALIEKNHSQITEGARMTDLDTDEFVFILINAVKPLFITLMEHFQERINDEQWYRADCPFCGYYPDMSMIVDSEGGKRYLHCALCEMTWVYKRIGCTICGNEDGKTLGYFVHTDEETPYRIDYCEKCKGYIKTLRVPKFSETAQFDLTVENIITLNLDHAAIHNGFSRP